MKALLPKRLLLGLKNRDFKAGGYVSVPEERQRRPGRGEWDPRQSKEQGMRANGKSWLEAGIQSHGLHPARPALFLLGRTQGLGVAAETFLRKGTGLGLASPPLPKG